MENLNERDAEYIIDRLLAKKGWRDDPQDPKRNVFRQKTYEYEDTDGKIKKIRPDYVFYDNSDSPILVLEVKKPNVKLYECLEKAKKVCKIINAPLAVASDAFKYFSYHLTFNREYLINNRPLEDLPSPQELSSVRNNYFYLIHQGKVIASQKEFEELLGKINDKLWEEGADEGSERFIEFCKLLFLRLISNPNDTQSSWQNIISHLQDQNLKTIINNELKRHQQYYKIGKYASSLKIRDAVIIKEIIEEMNKIDFAQSDFDAKGVIFEYFLKRKGKNDLAQYFTPRTIVRFMVNYLSPKFGEKVYDPFCGSGGMLIEAFNFIRKQAKTLTNLAEQNNQNANVECDFCQKFFSSQLVKLISEQNKKICEKCLSNLLKRQTFYGKDKATVAYVAKLNMILSGDGHNNIHRVKDTLKEKVENKYEVVITNIPFNMATKFGGIYKIPSNDANAICVQHCLEALKKEKGSRAGIIVPDKFTFFNGYKDLRKKLFEEFTVTVISLPLNTFTQTSGKGHILFLERERERDEIHYYEVKQVGFTLDALKEPINENDLNDILLEKFLFTKITKEQLENNQWKFRPVLAQKGFSLEEVLREIKPKMALVEPEKAYNELTIRIKGRGVEKRVKNKKDYIIGSQIKSKRYLARSDLIIMSKIDARNGAIGVIPKNLNNSLISSTFLLFEIKEEFSYLSPYFLVSWLTTEYYQEYFESLSKGTTNRRSITSKEFLNAPIDLTIEELKQKNLEFTKQKELELELELATVRQKIKEIIGT